MVYLHHQYQTYKKLLYLKNILIQNNIAIQGGGVSCEDNFGDENNTSLDIDDSDRDELFREAAEIIVTSQQGSASLLQRKLKLGYNRAGRIIDQMEAAGIVGPFEGSKARQVLISDLNSLDQFLNNQKESYE